MLINGNEFLLFHKDTFNQADEKVKTPILRVKLQGDVGKEYFEFFSFENLFVNKSILYFCDLVRYKMNGYRGSESSWRAYESTIKRFLLHMVEARKQYDVNQENRTRNIPMDFMFYTYNGEHSEPVKYTTINEVFASIERIDLSNKVYGQYTPANIRKALAEYLFVECGVDLAEVIDLLGIDVNNFSRYITNDMIQRALQKRARDISPMEALVKMIDA